jgi:RNA polymerase sigma-70 factor (ECF subfamily)
VSRTDDATWNAGEDRIAVAWRAGRAAWPALAVSESGFRDHLMERLSDPSAAEVLAFTGADLYLAYACSLGDHAALAIVEDLVAPMLARVAQRWRHARVDPADLAQALRVRLFVGEREAPPRIAHYRGDGPLKHWLRIAAAHVVVDLSRRQRERFETLGSDEMLLARITEEDGPELAFLRAEYRAKFKSAFARAFAALDDRERTLLRLRFLDGLRLEEIAGVAGVHRVTVSKALARACDRLGAALADDLGESLRGDDPAAALALIRSRLSLSIERLLTGRGLAGTSAGPPGSADQRGNPPE